MKTTGDLLVIVNGDVVDYHQGAAGDVTEKTVEFDLDGEVVPVKRGQGLRPDLPRRRTGTGRAGRAGSPTPADRAGRCESMTLAEQPEWTTVAGARASCPLDQVSQIDLSRGKIVYLSDLKPESVAYTPYFPLDKELPAEQKFFRLRAGPEPGIEAVAAGRQTVQQGTGPAQPHGGGLLSARPVPPLSRPWRASTTTCGRAAAST